MKRRGSLAPGFVATTGGFATRAIGIFVAAIVAIVAIVWIVGFVAGAIQERQLHTVESTFVGLSRSEAYARLERMCVLAEFWPDANDRSIPNGTPASALGDWPTVGDAGVVFRFVGRPSANSGCGAEAMAVLSFVRERVATVTEKCRYASMHVIRARLRLVGRGLVGGRRRDDRRGFERLERSRVRDVERRLR